ncbi:Cold-regulated 413 protein [Dillenia turbinata]|uniref:Cold-regulated 413 protein n=1 Tax=Dillenia turbinata TaxID=194707 RepID=A0AAN8VMK9_9MAGN
MMSVSLSCSPNTFSLYATKRSFLSPPRQNELFVFSRNSTFVCYNPLRLAVDSKKMKRSGRIGAVCYNEPLTPRNLQWISTVSLAVLMLSRGTSVQKSFLVPLFALQAPPSIISWIKGEYGAWAAFLALLVRLFFFIPGELELPFVALLLVLIAPYPVMSLRGTKEGTIVSLAIAGYLALQHFSRAGSMRKAFDRGSIVATISIICIAAVPCLFLF